MTVLDEKLGFRRSRSSIQGPQKNDKKQKKKTSVDVDNDYQISDDENTSKLLK